MSYTILIVAVIAVALLIALLSVNLKPSESPQRRAGKQGEKAATSLIEKYLTENDILLTNVSIEYEGKPTELDNVIINKYGIFIVEVKNYVGTLYGTEDDYEWEKIKVTDAGNPYVKMAKNPIKQVKRQIYILAQYLRSYGVDVWVEGYALLLQDNSPVKSKYILSPGSDLYKIFHKTKHNMLSSAELSRIRGLLEQEG